MRMISRKLSRVLLSIRRNCTGEAIENILATLKPKPKVSHLYTKYSQQIYAVEPVLNFNEELKNMNRLEKLHSQRGLPTQHLVSLPERYHRWLGLTLEISQLQNEMKSSMDESEQSDLNTLRKEWRGLEDSIYDCLRIPNHLLAETPIASPKIIAKFLSVGPEDGERKRAESVLKELGYLRFTKNPGNVFLRGTALRLLNALERYCVQVMKTAGCERITVPSMVRPAVVEGCLLDKSVLSSDPIFPSTDLPSTQRLQLVGVSLPAFLSLFTRKTLTSTVEYPVNLFASGPAYGRIETTEPVSLFGTSQYPAVRSLSMEKDRRSALMEYGKWKVILRNLIRFLKLEACSMQESAEGLNISEMAKVSFRSGHDGSGAELASISFYGSYLSDKLRMYFEEKDSPLTLTQRKLEIFSVEVNLFALLAAIVEGGYGWNCLDPKIPPRIPFVLKKFMGE